MNSIFKFPKKKQKNCKFMKKIHFTENIFNRWGVLMHIILVEFTLLLQNITSKTKFSVSLLFFSKVLPDLVILELIPMNGYVSLRIFVYY